MTAPARWHAVVGNDVVDTEQRRLRGKSADERLLDRVLAPAERRAVREANAEDERSADRLLWGMWAAKEAAYKVASKVRDSPPVFEHAAFETSLREPADVDAPLTVVWNELVVEVHPEHEPGVLHMVGTAAGTDAAGPGPSASLRSGHGLARLDAPGAPWEGPLERLIEQLTEDEREAVHSLPSAAVRIGARGALAAGMGIEEQRIEIVCRPGPIGRRPPQVRIDGQPATVDVSLSHHGEWIGWAWIAAARATSSPRGN